MCLLTFKFTNETLEIQLPRTPGTSVAGSDRCGRRGYRPHPALVGSTQIPPPPPGGDAVIGRGHRGRQLDSGPPSRASPAWDPWDLSDPAPAGQCWEDDSVGQVEGRVSETGKADSPSRQPEAPRTGQTPTAGPRPRTERTSQGPGVGRHRLQGAAGSSGRRDVPTWPVQRPSRRPTWAVLDSGPTGGLADLLSDGDARD